MLVEICYVRVFSLNRFHSTFLFSLTCYIFYFFWAAGACKVNDEDQEVQRHDVSSAVPTFSN